MEISTMEYNGKIVRFLKMPENGLLIKSKDVYAALGLNECLSHVWLDLAEAVCVAGKNDDTNFAMWLNETFAEYESITLVRPQ